MSAVDSIPDYEETYLLPSESSTKNLKIDGRRIRKLSSARRVITLQIRRHAYDLLFRPCVGYSVRRQDI